MYYEYYPNNSLTVYSIENGNVVVDYQDYSQNYAFYDDGIVVEVRDSNYKYVDKTGPKTSYYDKAQGGLKKYKE